MHYKTKEAAVKEYGHLKPKATALLTALKADEHNWNDEEVQEIFDAIYVTVSGEMVTKSGAKMTKEEIAEAQANHPFYKWFDVFEVSIQKKEKLLASAGRKVVQITGWELGKKGHAVFISPGNAKDFNAFANGIDPQGNGERGKLWLPRDEYKNGDIYPYKTWAKDQGVDPDSDQNLL